MSERIHTDTEREDAPAPPGREGGPVERDRGNREVPPATPAPETPADTDPDGARDLESRLAAAEAEAAEHLAHLQRLAAEFDNFRKRTARDQASVLARANERLVKELLPIVDDLGRALEAADAHEDAKLADGVRLVHRSLDGVLAREGLEEIPTEGAFDPHVHAALLTQPSEAPEGTVIQVLQKGYRLGDRVLRPARVVVAAALPQPTQAEHREQPEG
jgi:molecular chaperone GrpE